MGFVYRAQRGVGRGACILLGTALLYSVALAQALIPAAAAPSSSTPATPQDSLGRSTPRGTVLGFLSAARQGDYEGAAEYVNTRQRGAAAAALAKELYVVLDHGLPPALAKLSDKPEGSQRYPAEPNQE